MAVSIYCQYLVKRNDFTVKNTNDKSDFDKEILINLATR